MAKKLVLDKQLTGWVDEIRRENPIAAALLSPKRRTTEVGNFVAYHKDTGLFSYSPRRVDKDGNPLELGFTEKGRISGKTGRIIRLFLQEPNAHNDKTWEAFHNSIVALSNGNLYTFGFVRGEDLRHFYNQKNYSPSPRQRIYSCMQGSAAQKYLGIYAENPEVVELFCCFDPMHDNKILGRSLVWTCTDGKRRHDTIYAGDVIRNAMSRELAALGISPLGYEGTQEVQLTNVLFKQYPSVDRMRYLDTVTKVAHMGGTKRNYTIHMAGVGGNQWGTHNPTCAKCKKTATITTAVAYNGKAYCVNCIPKLPDGAVTERLIHPDVRR